VPGGSSADSSEGKGPSVGGSGHRATRIVLVGFMGAGKSAVGRALAARLGWRFVDVDDAVEEREGRGVAEIFAESGEARFRALEAEAAAELLADRRVVVATGGGWGAHPGRLRALPDDTLAVWLEVSPETAVRRAARQPGRRPLLEGADPVGVARELLAERVPHYAHAQTTVDTEGRSVDDVTTRILEILEEEYELDTNAE